MARAAIGQGQKGVRKSSLSVQAQPNVCFINDYSGNGSDDDDHDDDLFTDNTTAVSSTPTVQNKDRTEKQK